MQEIILIIAGLLGLWFGPSIAVPAAQRIARRLHVSELLIGLTVVSIGTSLPEISTSVMSGVKRLGGLETSGIAVGNIIGSEIAQITLALGICGLVTMLYTTRKSLKRDGTMLLVAIFAMIIASFDGFIVRLEGIILMLIYLVYLLYIIKEEKAVVKNGRSKKVKGVNIWKDIGMIAAGIAVLIYASHLVVTNGAHLALQAGIEETIVGVFVGLGTTLPELTIAISGLFLGAKRISIGNLIGSNITDPLLSLGAGASLSGFSVSTNTLFFDFPFWLVATGIVLILMHQRINLSREESAVLVALYALFIYLRVFVIAL